MNCNILTEGAHAIIQLTGDFDLSSAPDAREQILRCLDEGQHVIVDLCAVSHIDSSGLAVLVEGCRTAKKNGLRFGLVGAGRAVMLVLQLAHVDKILPLHASIESALGAGD